MKTVECFACGALFDPAHSHHCKITDDLSVRRRLEAQVFSMQIELAHLQLRLANKETEIRNLTAALFEMQEADDVSEEEAQQTERGPDSSSTPLA